MAGGGTPPTPPTPGDLSNYVQDGLVMHLDGINKGGTSGRWTSLVGSTYFTLNSHSIEESNAILMDGAGAITATSPVSVNYTVGTIEVCAQVISTGSCAIYFATTNNLGFIVGGEGYSYGTRGTGNQWNVTKQSLFTASANNVRFMFNGVVGGTKTQNNWSAQTAHTIGGRTASNYYYANARIYSIRIYNRQLTEAEMLQNQKVDDARFNLGLNI